MRILFLLLLSISSFAQGIRPMAHRVYVDNDATGAEITPAQLETILDNIPQHTTIAFESGENYESGGTDLIVDYTSVKSYRPGSATFQGSESLSGNVWTSETGGFYSTPLATAPKWVVNASGEMARQGESAWITTTASATATTFTADLDAYNAVESLVGVKVRHKEFNFRLSYEHTATNYNTTTNVLTVPSGVVGGANGMPIKLYGQKQFATLEGDWWYNDADDELWIKTASDPTGTDIRVITEDYAFNVQASNVTIEDLEFQEYFESAIEAPDAPDLTLTSITIHDNRQNGLMLYGNSTTVTGNGINIARCGLQGMHIGGISSSAFSNIDIDETGQQANIGWPVDTYWIKTGGCAIAFFWDSGEARTTPNDVDFTNINLTNSGYMGALVLGDDHDFNGFNVNTFCTEWNDGGGMYTIHRASLGPSTKNVTFSNGIITNGVGNVDGVGSPSPTSKHAEGMYVDNGSELISWNNVTSSGNSDFGALINWDTQKTTITNCTIAGNFNSQVAFRQDTDGGDSPVFPNNDGNIFTDNIVVSRALQYCMEATSYNGSTTYNPFSDSGDSNNNIYVRPYGTFPNISKSTSTGTPTAHTLSSWRTFISDDASSAEVVDQAVYISPGITEDEVAIVANPTNATDAVTIPSGREDVEGNALLTSQNIAAWSSLVYLPQTWLQPDLFLDTFTAANGTNISGRSPNVGPVPNIIAGTHTISSNSLICSVGGVVSYNLGTPDLVWTDRITVTNLSDGFFHYGRMADNTTSGSNRIIVFITSGVARIWQNASTVIAETPFTAVTNKSYLMSIVYNGANVRLYMDGALILEGTVTTTTGNYFGILNGVNRTTDNMAASTNVF